MRITRKHLLLGAVLLPLGGFAFAFSGVMNIAASTGHWGITEWFLHSTMRWSVRTYSLGVKAPEELPREGLQAAAGHFQEGCAVCHGAPGEARSPALLAMLPPPPDLSRILSTGKWTDAELFRIVKHGIRFTGMPSWPTQDRDDEAWAMVGFLRQLPTLDEASYRELAFGPSAETTGEDVAAGFDAALAYCARCHGEDGIGRGEAVPVIAGQREAYLLESLEAYVAGRRESGVMELAAIEADPELLDDLAAHFAGLPMPSGGRSGGAEPDPALVARGREIAERGIPEREIPACASCHERPERNPVYPTLNGQKPYYLKQQLQLFAQEKRGGTEFHHLMQKFAHYLEPEDIEAVAAYFSSRPPRRDASVSR